MELNVRNKIPILVLVVFVAIASMQMSFAQEDYAAVIGCGTWDNEFESGAVDPKDVGDVFAKINDGDDLTISVYNAYPGYEACVNFTVKNVNDTTSIFVEELLINNVYENVEMDVDVTYLNGDPIPLGAELLSGETMECLVTIIMLPAANQGQSYGFSVDLDFGDGLP